VVLHHPDGFLRPEVAGLLHPAASHEVRRVSCCRASRSGLYETSGSGSAGAFPTTLFTPLEEFPPTAAVPHRCGRCLRAVASLPSRLLGLVPFPVPGFVGLPWGDSTSRLSSAVGSVTPARPLPAARRPILPWALFPFEVLLRTVGPVPAIRPSDRVRRAPLHPRPLARRGPGWPPPCGDCTRVHRRRPRAAVVPRIEVRIYLRSVDRVRCGGSDPSAGSIPAESVRSRSS